MSFFRKALRTKEMRKENSFSWSFLILRIRIFLFSFTRIKAIRFIYLQVKHVFLFANRSFNINSKSEYNNLYDTRECELG